MKRLTTILFLLPLFALAQKKITIGAGSAVPQSRQVNTQYSLTGGGNLSADRTLKLVNDVSAPGNWKGYVTNGSGTRGWLDVPYIDGDSLYYLKGGSQVRVPDTTELLKINASSPSDHDVIAYDSATASWKNMAGAWETSRQRLLRQLGSSIISETFPSYEANTNSTISTGSQYYYLFSLDKTTTLRGMCFIVYTAGVFTAANDNKVALYKLSNDTLNLVASSASDGNIFKTAGFTNVDFTSDYTASPGVYAMSLIYNYTSSQTTQPQLAVRSSSATTTVSSLDIPSSIKVAGVTTSVTTIPTSIKFSTIPASGFQYWMAVRRR